MKIKFVFIVLHYLAFDMTKECVGTLISTFGNMQNYKIVVVDNASPNGSGQTLQKLYSDNQFVDVLLNNENSGFARGNNVGYVYAKEKYDPDFIIAMNNDVLINQAEFLDYVEDNYKSNRFAILGPDIYCLYRKIHQNPFELKMKDIDYFYNRDKELSFRVKHFGYYYYFWQYVENYILNPLRKIKHLLFDKCNNDIKNGYKNKIERCILHGACMIFSRDFIQAREYAFNPLTFMYSEERILYLECSQIGLVMQYDPKLKVIHLEGMSTKEAAKNKYKKKKFILEQQYKSNKILLEVYKNIRQE